MKQAQTYPSIPKDGITKTSSSQKYTNVTAACLANYVWDNLTVPEISLAMHKRSLHVPLRVIAVLYRRTIYIGICWWINTLCSCIFFESWVFLHIFLDPCISFTNSGVWVSVLKGIFLYLNYKVDIAFDSFTLHY